MRRAVLIMMCALGFSARAEEVGIAPDAWRAMGESALQERLAVRAQKGRAKNIILFIGDGNGVATNYATRLYAGQQAGGLGEEHALAYEAMPYLALAKTYNVNAQTPDSAGTATAIMTGVKTRAGVVNLDARVVRGDCAQTDTARLSPISARAHDMGKSVGVVTTTRITHATPASVYAYAAERDFEDDSALPDNCDAPDIATQLTDAMRDGRVDVAMGGGRQHFLPATERGTGKRKDGRDLLAAIRASGVRYVWDSMSLKGVRRNGTPILGLFDASHMDFEHDRTDAPSLAEMTRTAISTLALNPRGFFLMVEGGRIDHANHGNNLHRAVTDGVAFDDAVRVAMQMTRARDTLIIVTADHAHGLAFNGYCGRGSPINGLCHKVNNEGIRYLPEPTLDKDGRPYTAAVYANGVTAPAKGIGNAFMRLFMLSGRDATDDATARRPDYRQESLVPLRLEAHSGVDVAVYARGACRASGERDDGTTPPLLYNAPRSYGEMISEACAILRAGDRRQTPVRGRPVLAR